MPYELTLLKENTDKSKDSPDQIVGGTNVLDDENLEAQIMIVLCLWVNENRSIEISFTHGN